MLNSRSICRSSRPLHHYQTICRPGSGPVVIHLPHLSLIDTVRLRLDRRQASSRFKVRIDEETFGESFTEDGVVVYPIRWAAVSLHLEYELVREHCLSWTVFGYDLSQTPESSQLIDLLNLSVWFREHQLWSHLLYSDLLSGLALIQSRSFLQASELLYSTSFLLEKIHHIREDDLSNASALAHREIGIPIICNRESLLLLSAAALYPTMKSEKLLRILGHLAGYSTLSLSDLHRTSLMEPLVEIVTNLMLHEILAIRQAASRTLEFLLETIGCDCVVMMDHVISALIMIQDDMDLVEPVLQAILSNIYLMSADAVHDLVLDVIGPGLHQALAYPLSDCSVGVCLRLLLGALTQLKTDVRLSVEILRDLFDCYHERYQDLEWILDQIWDLIDTYDPVCLQEIPVVDIVISILGRASTAASACTRRALRLIIRIHGVLLERILDGSSPYLYNYAIELPDLISKLAQALTAELNRGDLIAIDLFKLYWQSLVLTISLYRHSLDSDDDYETVRLDQLGSTIIQAANHMICNASLKPPLVQVIQVVVPDLEPNMDLILLLRKMMFWVPETVSDNIFDLIHMLVSRLRHHLTWEHIHDMVWILCHRSTTRSISSNRCRRLIQEIIMQNGSFSMLAETLETTTDPVRFRSIIEFLTEAIDYIDISNVDLVTVISCLEPILLQDLYGCRYSSLSMLKKLLFSEVQVQLDTAVVEVVLASGSAIAEKSDPESQLLVAELVGNLFQRRSWPWSYTSRSWSYLQLCDQTTNWDNVRRMAQWASLIVASSYFSESDLLKTGSKAWRQSAQIWHEAICRACESRSCWKTRLWGLKLIWIVSFRSADVLRCAPDFVIDRLRILHQLDPDSAIRLSSGALISLIDGVPGANPSTCDTWLDLGSPPSSLTETTIKIPDLRHRPAPSTSSSPAPGLDDTGSDVSDGALDSDEHDVYIIGGEQDQRNDAEVDLDNDRIQANRSAEKGVEDDEQEEDLHTIKKKDSAERDTPGSYHGEQPQRDLSDLEQIQFQWVQD